jgi:tRNA A-37 threonylcarbamoyl transferase component Bud32
MADFPVYIKHNVGMHEYVMHKHIYELNILNVPRIISYDYHNKILTMEKLNNMSISDLYGEEIYQVPTDVTNKIRQIIKRLLDNEIEYPDITGYNFIEEFGEIWIIDFEHTKFIDKDSIKKTNNYEFIINFINGLKSWNPEFL